MFQIASVCNDSAPKISGGNEPDTVIQTTLTLTHSQLKHIENITFRSSMSLAMDELIETTGVVISFINY